MKWCMSLAVLAAMAGSIVMAEEPLPAFPGAEGWGAVSVGGRGGKVIHVTSLADSGPGSLREAIQTSGPRIIVFDVGGTIELKSNLFFSPNEETWSEKLQTVDEQERARIVEARRAERAGYGNVTFAGQTAPGGITILGGELGVCRFADNLVFRHVRGRGCHNAAGFKEDHHSIQIWQNKRVIIDHCSFAGGIDEVVGGNGASQFTFQWSTIEEPAKWGQGGAQHDERGHNKGFLVAHNSPEDISYHHNFAAHSPDRNPLIMATRVEIRNSVAYDGAGATLGNYQSPEVRINAIGNTFRGGPKQDVFGPFGGHAAGETKEVFMYCADNAIDTPLGRTVVNDIWAEVEQLKVRNVKFRGGFTKLDAPIEVPWASAPQPVEAAYEQVLAKAGAWPRDTMTRRLMQECRDRTGAMGLNGPYERFAPREDGPTSAKNDTDRDGMPNVWETAHGLNPSDPADGGKIVPKGASEGDRHAGYTFVEFYLNDLADSIVGQDDGPLVKVAAEAEGRGGVFCGHSGWTPRWGSPDVPLEIVWGGPHTLHKGSRVQIKALPQPGYRFAGWSAPASVLHEGGKVEGETQPRINVIADADLTVTARFEADPDYNKVVHKTYQNAGLKADVALYAYVGDFGRATHGQALAVTADGKVLAGVGDSSFDSRLLRFDPAANKTEVLGAVQAALPKDLTGKQDNGRIQAAPAVMPDGTVYFASHGGTYFGGDYPIGGGYLLKWTPGGGAQAVGTAAARGAVSYYDLLGDAKRGKLYAITSHGQPLWSFLVFDIAAGTWREMGQVQTASSGGFPPRSMIRDKDGNVFFLAEPKGAKPGTYRYDVQKDVLEGSEVVPTTVAGDKPIRLYWNQAATADGDTAYFISRVSVKGRWDFILLRAKLSDWPNLKYEDLGSVDPEGRLLESGNLSVTPDGKYVVVAGKCVKDRKAAFDGIWAYETATGKKALLADITDAVVESFGDEHARPLFNTYTGRNVVAKDGTIYVAVRKGEDVYEKSPTDVRLLAIRIGAAGE